MCLGQFGSSVFDSWWLEVKEGPEESDRDTDKQTGEKKEKLEERNSSSASGCAGEVKREKNGERERKGKKKKGGNVLFSLQGFAMSV